MHGWEAIRMCFPSDKCLAGTIDRNAVPLIFHPRAEIGAIDQAIAAGAEARYKRIETWPAWRAGRVAISTCVGGLKRISGGEIGRVCAASQRRDTIVVNS